MSRRGSCSSWSATIINTAATKKTRLLLVGQTGSLTFILDHHPKKLNCYRLLCSSRACCPPQDIMTKINFVDYNHDKISTSHSFILVSYYIILYYIVLFYP